MRSNVSKLRWKLIPTMLLLIGVTVSSSLAASKNDSEAAVQNRNQIAEAEQILASLGYMVTNSDGRVDFMTRHAVMAFQKVEGLKRTGVLTPSVLERLRAAATPTPKYSGPAHVEVDITRQVLFVVDDEGKVTTIVPVSTGSGERYFDKERNKWDVANTPRGEFKIQRKINGARTAPLGQIYYPSYFFQGWAVHGSGSIPPKPASHGCVRVPRGADQKLFGMMPVGMQIYLYD
jgi:lipoprotein-anchoring transpeptidase ErfK/SrfK